MTIYKCPNCGWDDNGSGDTAHICGPVNIKKAPVTIQTVAANLRNTIAGKEALLERSMDRLRSHYKDRMDSDTWFSIKTTVDFLEVNIDELKRILADVEKCT